MEKLRTLTVDDLPRLANLRRRIFSHSAQASEAALADYYKLLFFENPWRDGRFPSFVQEAEDGSIVGFVGQIPRPMRLGTETLTAVTTTELMVNPEARGFVGPKLLRRVFDGPQDITFSDRSNEAARALFESLGGSAALWYSAYWTVSLDGTALHFQTGSQQRPVVARIAGRLARMVEKISAKAVSAGDHSGVTVTPFTADVALSLLRALGARNTLVPEYSAASLDWLLDRLRRRNDAGSMRSGAVTQQGSVIGAFIYYARPDGEAEVVQLLALPGRERAVWQELKSHARAAGGAILRGRMERRFAQIMSEDGVPLTVGQPWTIVKAKRADVATQFLTGTALFTRLDAEWWIDS